jgi:hypothetical protein
VLLPGAGSACCCGVRFWSCVCICRERLPPWSRELSSCWLCSAHSRLPSGTAVPALAALNAGAPSGCLLPQAIDKGISQLIRCRQPLDTDEVRQGQSATLPFTLPEPMPFSTKALSLLPSLLRW